MGQGVVTVEQTLLPRITAFIGWWLFVNVDVLFADRTRSAIGGELVFPDTAQED
jgi:hypothetical protein